ADIDFEAADSHDLYITASDSLASSAPQAVTVTVGDTAETIQLANGGVRFADTGVTETSVTGGSGDDQIVGSGGADRISGGKGDDVIDGAANAASEVVITLGGTDRGGVNPEYEVYADGVLIHTGEITWAQDGASSFDPSLPGAYQDVTVALPSGTPDQIVIEFVNDSAAGVEPDAGEDRNIHVDKITLGDTVYEGEDAAISGGHAFSDRGLIWGDGSTATFDTSAQVTEDTAVWEGPLSDFSVSYDAGSDTFTIADLNASDGDEGTDTVTGVESFEFNGTTYTAAEMQTKAAQQANTAPGSPNVASGGSVAENSAAGTTVATLNATDADGDSLTYTLTDSGGTPVTDSNFEIVGNEIRVKSGADIDFEAADSHDLYVTASDGIESSSPQAITVTVTDTAEDITLADTGVSFTDTGVAETSITGGTGDDAITAHDDGGTLDGGAGNDTLTGGAGDDVITTGTGADTVDGGEGSDTVYVHNFSGGVDNEITDSGSSGTDRIVLSGNDYGSFELGTDLTGIEEIDGSALTGEFIKSATASDYDFSDITLTGVDEIHGGDAGETITGSAGGDYIKGFGGDDVLSGGLGDDRLEGWSGTDTAVWDGDLSDFIVTYDSGTDTFTITDLNAADGDEGTDTITEVESFAFNGTTYTAAEMQTEAARQANTAPSDITMTGGTVTETVADGGTIGTASDPAGTTVATLATADADAGDSHTYTIESDPSDKFEIVGNEIRVKSGAVIDFETDESFDLTIKTTDQYGGAHTETVTLNVQDIEGSYTAGSDGEVVTGTSEEDVITGGSGSDTLLGGAGDDIIYTGRDSDIVDGGEGSDTIYLTNATLGLDNYVTDSGTSGHDRIVLQGAGNGSYELDTDLTGIDEIDGSGLTGEYLHSVNGSNFDFTDITLTGLDKIAGGATDETIIGSAGDDTIDAGAGADQLTGGLGNDTLIGGDGSDTFFYALGDGQDIVTGGTSTSWVDAITLSGVSGGVQTDAKTYDGAGWTLVLDDAHAFDSVDANALELSDDASGTITFDDGGSIDFTGIDRVSW
ncbi:MAG: cadherin domain-containing protein, partial [Pseudomonadota bacterium]